MKEEFINSLESGIGFPLSRLDYYQWTGEVKKNFAFDLLSEEDTPVFKLVSIVSIEFSCMAFLIGRKEGVPYITTSLGHQEDVEDFLSSELFNSLSQKSQDAATELAKNGVKYQRKVIAAQKELNRLESEQGDTSILGESTVIKETRRVHKKYSRRLEKVREELNKLAESKSEVVLKGDIPALRKSDYWDNAVESAFESFICPFEIDENMVLGSEDDREDDLDIITQKLSGLEDVKVSGNSDMVNADGID